MTTGTGVVYQQSSDSLGLVVIPAEEFTINKAGTGSKDGDSWAFGMDTMGYFGDGYMQSVMLGGSDGSTTNAADVVVMGRNIGSADVAAAEEVWDAVERPVLTMNMWGLRENRANWVPAGIGCENINGDTLVVNGIIQNDDAVFGGLTDTINWWNGSFSSFVPDSARVAAGNGTLMIESEDLRPLFMRWKANTEFYPGAGHAPSHVRSFMGMGNDNDDPANYFGFSDDAGWSGRCCRYHH